MNFKKKFSGGSFRHSDTNFKIDMSYKKFGKFVDFFEIFEFPSD